jgi:hypothetical protein
VEASSVTDKIQKKMYEVAYNVSFEILEGKETGIQGAYDVEYISDGSRGRKHFVTRTVVKAGKLYVLTVVCKQDDWKQVENDVWASVSTFIVLDP